MGISVPSNWEWMVSELWNKLGARDLTYSCHPVLQIVGHVLFDGLGFPGPQIPSLVPLQQSAVQGHSARHLDTRHGGTLRLVCIVCSLLGYHCEYGVSTDEVRLCGPA
jgi:hypothetical protein